MEVNSISTLTGLGVGWGPFGGSLKVSIKILPTFLLDIKVDDDVVLRDFDIVDLACVDIFELSLDVHPSILRGSSVISGLGWAPGQDFVK